MVIGIDLSPHCAWYGNGFLAYLGRWPMIYALFADMAVADNGRLGKAMNYEGNKH